MTDNLVGGDEGISDAGFSVARLIPNPLDFPRGDWSGVFRHQRGLSLQASGAISPTSVTCAAITTSRRAPTSILAVSCTRAQRRRHRRRRRLGRFVTNLGMDATVRWRSASTRHLPFVPGAFGGDLEPPRTSCDVSRSIGYYVSGDYQFARRWFTGVRFDRSDRADDAAVHRRGRVADADLLAERVQPDSGAVSSYQICGGIDGERAAVPVAIFDRRSRRASVLTTEERV